MFKINFGMVLSFINAVVAGKASFFVYVGGHRFQATLVNNGLKTAPTLGAIPQLIAAVETAAVMQNGLATATVGANTWTVSVFPA